MSAFLASAYGDDIAAASGTVMACVEAPHGEDSGADFLTGLHHPLGILRKIQCHVLRSGMEPAFPAHVDRQMGPSCECACTMGMIRVKMCEKKRGDS